MSIKALLKQNLALVVGLTFPILLIIIFLLATVIPKALGNPPQYELLFISSRFDFQNTDEYDVDFSIKSNQLKAKAMQNHDQNIGHTVKKLIVYDGKTEAVKEINIDWSRIANRSNEVLLEETKSLKIDPSDTSPDGYMLDRPHYGNSGLLGGLFGGRSNDVGYRIKKGSVAYKLPVYEANYYEQVQFLGWIIK
ncbi:MAG TPA: hypothetical protein VK974_07465 [Methylophilaceae bacterium]|nr:hypothetical protein [Methylophilaceae bacterium]